LNYENRVIHTMSETSLSPEVVQQHGLTPEEYSQILRVLGRAPNLTELGIFSVMWSEHCSYKSSRVHLKRLPTRGPCVLQGPGENAGVIDLGDGLAIAFKIESHNHPSFVEPFQGAATGVGGILRDIFTMGARPIAAMNSLRFGSILSGGRQENDGSAQIPNQDKTVSGGCAADVVLRNRRILRGVVSGIAFYGNCFGVPTVGGEVYFENCYAQNPLVNAFALGIFKRDAATKKPRIFLGRATGVGNAVIYVGAKTGRDGIHGASLLASSEFDETTAAKRPNVQVGDPFLEKCLLEACLEAMDSGAVLGIQDMGAAGLTCSTSEMAARGETGIEIDLKLVPQRETGMTPYEIMLSESQERMLLVAERHHVQDLQRIFAKWGLDAVEIGHVTGDGVLRIREHGRVVAEIPAKALADEAPLYNRPMEAPSVLPEPVDKDLPHLGPLDAAAVLKRLLCSENLCSRRWVYEQYDHMVRTNTCVLPGADAAVIRIKGTSRGIAMSLDGNGRYGCVDPREGAKLAVAESCRNLACVGARPLAATNCLNFGNPEKPKVMWSFSEVIDGIKEACEVFETPITGGNVSFYNETFGAGIYPTPVIGMVGIVEDVTRLVPTGFQHEGDRVVLIGDVHIQPPDVFLQTASEFLKTELGQIGSRVAPVDLHFERSLHEAVREMQREDLLYSCHDLTEGGLAVALAECCFASLGGQLGCEVEASGIAETDFASYLFAEIPSRILTSCSPGAIAALGNICGRHNVPFRVLGHVVKESLVVRRFEEKIIEYKVSELHASWSQRLQELLSQVR
jgi:phosphoribosylformylglycinamidine synthase